MSEQLSVPVEAYIAAVEEQRNAALTSAAQMKALAQHLEAENGRLTAENEKLRADAEGPFNGS